MFVSIRGRLTITLILGLICSTHARNFFLELAAAKLVPSGGVMKLPQSAREEALNCVRRCTTKVMRLRQVLVFIGILTKSNYRPKAGLYQ